MTVSVKTHHISIFHIVPCHTNSYKLLTVTVLPVLKCFESNGSYTYILKITNLLLRYLNKSKMCSLVTWWFFTEPVIYKYIAIYTLASYACYDAIIVPVHMYIILYTYSYILI